MGYFGRLFSWLFWGIEIKKKPSEIFWTLAQTNPRISALQSALWQRSARKQSKLSLNPCQFLRKSNFSLSGKKTTTLTYYFFNGNVNHSFCRPCSKYFKKFLPHESHCLWLIYVCKGMYVYYIYTDIFLSLICNLENE